MALEIQKSLEEIAGPAWLRDDQGVIIDANAACLEMVGYPRNEWVGRNLSDFEARFESDFSAMADAFPDYQELLCLTTRAGTKIYVGTTMIAATRDGVPAMISFARDVSTFFHIAHRLRESLASEREARLSAVGDLKRLQRIELELRRSADARDQFVLVASHELKTPLTTLSLQLELIEKTLTAGRPQIPVEQIPAQISAARVQVQRLGRLIDHVRDLSQLEDLPLETRAETLDLAKLAREVVERFRPHARAALSPLNIKIDEPVLGNWDRFFFERMLGNLLSNAIKFGAGQPIDIRLETGSSGKAVLTVRDRGIGIAPATQPKLFQKFERGDSRPEVEGLGLGLYIVRRIVEAHSGRINLESEPGWGSVFWIEFPELPNARN